MPLFKTVDPRKQKKLLQQRDDAVLWHKCRDITTPLTRRKRGPRDLTGQKVGRLSVICRSPTTRRQWKCRCECGIVLWVDKTELRRSLNPSCGCSDQPKKSSNWKSGKEGTYSTWMWIKYRCLDASHSNYKWYGGRGIKICDRWMNFDLFYQDMGDRPEGKSIERLDVNGHYEPGNCAWATPQEQAWNRTNTVKVRHEGQIKTIRQVAEDTDLNVKTLNGLINKAKIGLKRNNLTGG